MTICLLQTIMALIPKSVTQYFVGFAQMGIKNSFGSYNLNYLTFMCLEFKYKI